MNSMTAIQRIICSHGGVDFLAEVRDQVRATVDGLGLDYSILPLIILSLFGEKPEWRDVIGRKGAYISTFR